MAGSSFGQAVEPERSGPPPLEDFEVDADKDGVPDGWYNLRDAKIVAGGPEPGGHCLRFENDRPGRPARASRAFGVDGRKIEALVVGLWVRQERIAPGERLGDDPALVIDFLGDQLRAVRRGAVGPWRTVGSSWVHVARTLPIPPETRDAILSVGLIGATGVLEIDRLTIEAIPVGGTPTTNLVRNGDFELGDPDAAGWIVDHGAGRSFPGYRSDASLELKASGARATAGLALPVGRFSSLELSANVKGSGLRGANAGMGAFFFLDDDGRPLPGSENGTVALNFSGSFAWQPARRTIEVPRGASRAIVQFEKASSSGTLWIDDVRVEGQGADGQWTPGHVLTDTRGWAPVEPSPRIAEGSALDASSLLEAPAGKHGFVEVRSGRLHFADGTRARFLGASLLPPTAFLDADRADALADRLARSGVNLVRLGELGTPLGPGRSLFDDTRDDNAALDPESLSRLDHLIAALKERGIYVALELQGGQKFRNGDPIPDGRKLPPGGGAAAAFDPAIRKAATDAAKLLLDHVNSETGLRLRDEPALAWITLAGELSIFDQGDAGEFGYPAEAAAVRDLMRKDGITSARKGWAAVESAQWKAMADDLRKLGVRVPIAGGSHWRREADYASAQAAPGLDLIDDRLFYSSPTWISPDRRSSLWSRDGGIAAGANRKRRADRPYVVGQWALQTQGNWATPDEGADLLLAAQTAGADDWDALIRRGIFLFPENWGASAAGTGGGEDIFSLPEVLNGIPQTYALLPHASSLMLRGQPAAAAPKGRVPQRARPGAGVGGWDPTRGRLVLDTPHTQGVAGWVDDEPADLGAISVSVDTPFAVVVVTATGPEPIATARRLLVTSVARVEPTGFRWADEWRRERADPGLPPLLREPVKAKLSWRRAGTIKAYALDSTGARIGPIPVEKVEGGVQLTIDRDSPAIHRELVVE
ncbi:hypothetical protein TA3x_002415 [Tundrisphaera sp. TA3]|uniref:hypothetical protein n=1 Tax=Tundrisphaera sp. TA3 TaxID=3435775 RepID=UPI003EB82685